MLNFTNKYVHSTVVIVADVLIPHGDKLEVCEIEINYYVQKYKILTHCSFNFGNNRCLIMIKLKSV